MSYKYLPGDNIFDIESLSNLYTDSHYFPACHRLDIYYLSDVSGYHSFKSTVPGTKHTAEDEIKQRILECNLSLYKLAKDKKKPLRINFYDLTLPCNLARYCHFWGVTPNRYSALNFVNSEGLVHPISNKAVNYAKWKHTRPRAKWVSADSYTKALRSGKDYTAPLAMNMAMPYYTYKRTDPQYQNSPHIRKTYGITMGFNSNNYDLTMIAIFLGHVAYNDYARDYLNRLCQPRQPGKANLPLTKWYCPNIPMIKFKDQAGNIKGTPKSTDPRTARYIKYHQERHDLIHHILKPEFLRHYNNLMFTRYKRSMPQILLDQQDITMPSDRGQQGYFHQNNNPAFWIYKGWITSNRYLDVANLNEHMKFVPLKRIAAMKGWQILESKHVTANTTIIKDLTQIKDLLGYNNSDVQVTKLVFELPEYQDALTLRRILLKKFPQLTYNYSKTSALKRYYKKMLRKIKHAKNMNVVEKMNTKFKLDPIKKALDPKNKSVSPYNYYRLAKANADPQDVKIAPNNLRFAPLEDDASSAKLISNVIAPYHDMVDWPDIEFLFPDPRALKIFKRKHPEQKLRSDKPFNILEDTLKWTKEVDRKYHLSKYPPADQDHPLDKYHSLYKTFKPIYKLYKTVEGHNVNQTLEKYAGKKKLYNIRGELETIGPNINMTALLHRTNGNIPYLHRDGTSTGTTAVFSYGGIHGVEFKLGKYQHDYRHYLDMCDAMKQIKKNYRPKAVQTSLFSGGSAPRRKTEPAAVLRAKHVYVKLHGKKTEVRAKDYIKGTGSRAQWRDLQPPRLYKHPSKSSYSLNDKYSYVSVNSVSHEDFSGYYPMLISRLGIMWPHDEPKDTYHQIYVERLQLKHQLKKYTKNSPKWDDINKKQLLRKLLLNSASGAGDAKFYNSIRMNNKIISMRIMGQLFTWRMAQSVCLADTKDHAKVTSSNTDGVYLAGLPDKVNNVALQKAVRPLSLFISPVPLSRFVSKDANNRAEITNYGTKAKPNNVLTEAKGGTLNAWQGPSVTTTLSHPAIIDYTLAHYMSYYPKNPCNDPLDLKYMKSWIDKKRKDLYSDNVKIRADALIFFQWVIASNPNKHRYPFILPERRTDDTKDGNPVWKPVTEAEPIPHTNRLFLMKDGKYYNNALFLATRSTKISRSVYDRKYLSKGIKPKSSPSVLRIYDSWGDHCLPSGQGDGYNENCYVGTIAKMPSMPSHENVLIENHALYELPTKEVRTIADRLDYRAYLKLTMRKYYSSWDNYPEQDIDEINHVRY